jgi:DtxR family Mn-dependent transcriptional regulator
LSIGFLKFLKIQLECVNLYSLSARKLVHIAMKIQKSSEDYLESMLIMKEKHGFIRSIDVARHLGVTKPSVSYATKRLRENGYITMEADGLITLTDSGMKIARKMYERHKLLTKFLVSLGVDVQTACEDACKIEHDISQKTFDAICRHANADRDD